MPKRRGMTGGLARGSLFDTNIKATQIDADIFSDQTELDSPADGDRVMVVDVSATPDEIKFITRSDFIGEGLVSITNNTDNYVLTATGSSVNGEANLTFDGTILTIEGGEVNIDVGSGDPHLSFQIGNTDKFTIGVDDSDSDKFKIDTGATVGGATKFTMDSSGNVDIAGDLTISGDDLYMSTNTDGYVLIADGTNYNPVAVSGDIAITNAGVTSIASGVIVNADVHSSAAIAVSKTALSAGTGLSLSTNTLNVDAAQSGITSLGTLTGLTLDGDKNVTPGDGAMIHLDTSTITDNVTSGSGTATKYTHVTLEAPTLAATNSSVTTSDVATLYINAAATAGTNQTITRNYALWVDAGNVRFDGSIYSGTTHVIDSSGLVQVANQSNITGVGTISSGTWEGTDIGVAHGGTGASSLTSNALLTGNGTSAIQAESTLSFTSDTLTTSSTSANLPMIELTNTHAGATAGKIRFNKDSASGDDNDVMGTIEWYGTDAAENTHQRLAYVDSYIVDAADGSETSGLRFYVAENDATLTQGLAITGQPDDDGEIDVTIGAGAASTTTIAGTLTMGSTATLTNAGLVAVANQSNITGVGTISSGVWQGTAIASAYIAGDAITNAKIADNALDSEHYTDGSIDTAHIADDQVTLAKMAGLTRGSLIIGDSNGDPSELTKGSANYVLKSDGTDIAWAAEISGDITGVTAGVGLDGGGSSGGVTVDLDTHSLTEAAIANGDYLIFNDATDSNAPKREALADVATLFAGTASSTGLSASSSVLSVSDLHPVGVDGANNQLITDDGDGTVTSEAQLTFDGDVLAITGTGSAKGNKDILTITNDVNASDMDGTETSILFNQWYYDGSSPAVADAGRISIGTETDWTSTTSTQDSYMALETALNGTVTENVRITSAGLVGINNTDPASLLDVRGDAGAPGTLTLSTAETTVVDGDKLGRIDFQAPKETGTDAIVVSAAIWAESDVTFDASNNATDLVFATGHSEAAAEKIRITSQNEIGIAGANFGSDGQVLTSGGAGAAVAWEDPSSTSAYTSSSANEPVVSITNTHADATAGFLKFVKDPGSGQGADSDILGTITFHGTDASNNAAEELARMEAYIIEADDGSEAGGIKFYVAENDATMTAGLQILGVKDADGEIDVTIGAGAASTTIIAGTLTMGSTAAMTNAGLVSVANQSNITGLGTISSGVWEGTDIGVAHGGTGASSLTDNAVLTGTGTSAITAEANLTYDGNDLTAASSSDGKPILTLKTTHTTKTSSGELQFLKDAADTEDGEQLGQITFYGEDEGNNNTQFAEIVASISESDEGDEAGILEFKVAESDSTTTAITTGLKLEGEHATDGEIDVTIGAGAASTTTIAGTLTMGSTAAMTNAGLVSVANQSNITGLGTISSGVWEGTDVAVAHGGTGASSLTDNAILTGTGTSAITAESTLAFTGDTLTASSSSADLPMIELTNTHAGATAGKIRFNKDSGSGDDNDVMGTIEWFGTDAAENTHEKLAYIDSYIIDSAHGSEAAGLRFYVAENDATNTLGLQILGQADDDGEVDIVLGAGTASTTTVAGDLTISGGDITYGNGQNATASVAATAHNAAGKNLTLSAGTTTAGTTNNIAGGALTLQGGQGKGSGAGGDIIFQVANAGGSGSSLNSLATALTISDDKIATFADDIVIKDGGTFGVASANDALTISSGGIVTFKDDILIKDGGTIGNASVADVMTLASTGIVTFKDDILIKDGGTIGVASAATAITIASTGIVTLVDDLIIKDAGTIGSASDPDAIAISSGGVATFSQNVIVADDKTVTLGEAGKIDFGDTAPDDNEATGIIFSFTAGASLAVGDVVYMHTDGEVAKADADAATTMPAIGICVSSGSDGGAVDVMVQGVMHDTSAFPTFTVGNDVYVGTDAGTVQTAAPSGSGDTVQKVGVAIHADKIYFNFNTTEVLLA